MEHTSDTVYEGKLIGETTYPQRAEKYTEIQLSFSLPYGEGQGGAVKIDFFDAKEKVVHEIKKSDKLEHAHIAQVQFYLYVLAQNGMAGCTGVLEYPKLRQTHIVEALTAEDTPMIEGWLREITAILSAEVCPPLVKKPYCKTCSYYDFCFVDE